MATSSIAGFVEAALAESPQIDDVYVYGIPAASGAPGESDMVAAVVVNRDRFDSATLFSYCREALEPNFVPTYFEVLREIPKTASEKPQDRFLIEALCAGDAEIYDSAGRLLAGEIARRHPALAPAQPLRAAG